MLHYNPQSALSRHTVRPFTESDDTRGCNNTICPPEDEEDVEDYNVTYTGCSRRNGQNFGRVFLMLNYTDITQNTYIQS